MNFKPKEFFFCHFLVLFFLLSWFFPPTASLWRLFDDMFFLSINNILASSKNLQNVVAFVNSSLYHWIHDLIMLSFFSYYIFKGSKAERSKRSLSVLFSIILMIVVFVVINRSIIPSLLTTNHPGPTAVHLDAFRLSKVIDWIKVKDYSLTSFPADHATTVCNFCLFVFSLMGRRMCLFALVVSIPFLMARLIVGAHFATDVIMGSLQISLLCRAWFFATPFFAKLVELGLVCVNRLNLREG